MKLHTKYITLIFLIPMSHCAAEVRTQAGDVKDTRTTGKFFAGLEVELKLAGDTLSDAKGIRTTIDKAVDDSGRDLFDPEKQNQHFNALKATGGGEQVTVRLKNPARKATEIKELSGKLELHVPSADPAGTITISNMLAVLGHPIQNPVLKTAGVEVIVFNKKQFEIQKKAEEQKKAEKRNNKSKRVEANDSKAVTEALAKVDANDPKAAEKLGAALGVGLEGLSEAVAEAFSGMFSGFMTVGDNDLAFMTNDPKLRIISMEMQTTAGKKIETRGSSSSGAAQSRTSVIHYEQPIPDDARLQIYLATEKSIITVPLKLISVPLP
jgi:hypothetical protein